MNRPQSLSDDWQMTDRELDQIRQLIYDASGISISVEKRSLIRSRLQKRLLKTGLSSPADYLRLLNSPGAKAEREAFLSSMTTNVTSFFREAHHFDLLAKEILPDLAASAHPIRIWSAGCSSGPEPYSAAITVHETHPQLSSRVLIDATDIDTAILAQAAKGTFKKSEVSGLRPGMAERYFQTSKDAIHGELFTVRKNIAAMVKFRPLNLNSPWEMREKYDVIFCRNVAIYFDEKTQAALWRKLHTALRPGGWLLIGHSERIPAEMHQTLNPRGLTAYQKSNKPCRSTR